MPSNPWLVLGARPARLRKLMSETGEMFPSMGEVDMGVFSQLPQVQQLREVLRLAESHLAMGNMGKAMWYAKACISGFADSPVRDYKVSEIFCICAEC